MQQNGGQPDYFWFAAMMAIQHGYLVITKNSLFAKYPRSSIIYVILAVSQSRIGLDWIQFNRLLVQEWDPVHCPVDSAMPWHLVLRFWISKRQTREFANMLLSYYFLFNCLIPRNKNYQCEKRRQNALGRALPFSDRSWFPRLLEEMKTKK